MFKIFSLEPKVPSSTKKNLTILRYQHVKRQNSLESKLPYIAKISCQVVFFCRLRTFILILNWAEWLECVWKYNL